MVRAKAKTVEAEASVAGAVDTAVEETVAPKKSKSITKVVFTRKDGTTREFNEKLHGEDFVSIADEFEKTNEKFLAGRKDL